MKRHVGVWIVGLGVWAGVPGSLMPETVSAQVPTPASVARSGSILYFPDYVEGAGWSVQLVLGNIDAAAARVEIEVYDQTGQQISDLFDSGSTLEIPSLGSRVLRSTGTGAIRRGWIQVQSGAASVSGLLTYRHSVTGIEVGVNPVDLGSQFALFVEESSEIGTGVAIFKPAADSEIEIRLRDEEGNDPFGRALTAGDFQQRARTLPEWFQGTDREILRNFRGLLFLRTADGSEFAPLGLRFGKEQESLSAVPVIPIRKAAAGKMYWVDFGTSKIQRANLDGTAVEDLVTSGVRWANGLALDLGARKMYWTDSGSPPKIQRANLDGTGVENLITSGLSHPIGLALEPGSGKMYWADQGTSKIQRANLDGTGVEDLVASGLDMPYGLALDLGPGKMYWTDQGTSKIQRANLDGTEVEDLITSGLSQPVGLALDPGAGKMYWTDGETKKIQRANLDGAEVEDLVASGLLEPRGLALDLDNVIESAQMANVNVR